MRRYKRWILIFFAFMIIIFIFAKYKMTTIGKELAEFDNVGIEKIEVNFYVYDASPTFVIKSEDNINKIIEILNEIHIIPTNSRDISYGFSPLETYQIFIYGIEGKTNSYIKISANKYANLESDNYRIIFKKDLSQIYDVLVTEPQKDKIDEFYYNIKQLYPIDGR